MQHGCLNTFVDVNWWRCLKTRAVSDVQFQYLCRWRTGVAFTWEQIG